MSAGLHYLVSSLPLLRFGDRPTITSEKFLSACRDQLSKAQMELLESIRLVPGAEAAAGAPTAWRNWETFLRNELVRHRAAHLKINADDQRGEDYDAFPTDRKEFEEALGDSNPLHCERTFDQLRWRRLDDLEAGHDFDCDTLVVYRLRLLLLEKWAGFDLETGKLNLKKLVDTGLEQAAAHRTTSEFETAT